MGDVQSIDEAAPKRGRGRPRKAEQTEIPGTEFVTVPEIDDAAKNYVRIRDERMELTEDEVAASAKLLGLMKKHELTIYPLSDGRRVEIKHGDDKVKVRGSRSDEGED